MSTLRKRSAAIALTSLVALAGCGSSATSASTGSTATTPGASSSTPVTTTVSGSTSAPTVSLGSSIAPIPAADRSPAGKAGTAPTVVVPASPAPSQLESADLIVGKGPAAVAGDQLAVQYVLATYSSGKVVQSSWTSQPFQFTLGEGQVITGWDKGVVGMKAGGRRELIIPPSLGYGSSSPGAGIAANDTLVFVIDLLQIG